MQADCFKYYFDLAKRVPATESGVQILPMSEYFDNRHDESELSYKNLMPEFKVVKKEKLPDGCTFGVSYTALAMNPSILLPWLQKQLLARGVTFIRMEVNSLEDARKLVGKPKFVVNSSGLGARELAADSKVKPIRGQTMFVKTSFNELVMKEGSEYTYVIPRAESGGVILGGVKSDRLDKEVDVELKGDILRRVNRITNGAFNGTDLEKVTDIVGFRPGRDGGLRVEREGDVVHAYGAAGAGYIYSFGVAERVRELIEGGSTKSKL
jgi:glycine/D-amino acid oxidase-like deaminating enzyme